MRANGPRPKNTSRPYRPFVTPACRNAVRLTLDAGAAPLTTVNSSSSVPTIVTVKCSPLSVGKLMVVKLPLIR